MNVWFRVDDARTMGLGHLSRCLSLAGELRARNHRVVFILRDWGTDAAKLLEAEDLETLVLPAVGDDVPIDHRQWLGVEETIDASQTLAVADIQPKDWVIADHYGIGQRWTETMRSRGAKMVVIDDLADRPFAADAILNQNYFSPGSADPYANLCPASSRRWLGPTYALLRPEFAERHRQAKSRTAVRSILVNFGGADVHELIPQCLGALRSRWEANGMNVTVVLGRAASMDLPEDWPGIRVLGYTNDLAGEMIKADLALGACGVSTWERLCLGLPTIAYSVAKNQERGAKSLAKDGYLIYLGPRETLDPSTLVATYDGITASPEKMSAMSRAGQRLVDGRGTQRVADALEAMDES